MNQTSSEYNAYVNLGLAADILMLNGDVAGGLLNHWLATKPLTYTTARFDITGFLIASGHNVSFTNSGKPVTLNPSILASLYLNVPGFSRQVLSQVAADRGMTATLPWRRYFIPSGSFSDLILGRGSQEDWFGSFGNIGYRVQVSSGAGSTSRFRFEIEKYYDFDNPFGTPLGNYTTQQLQDVQAEGFAENFWITGTSGWFTG